MKLTARIPNLNIVLEVDDAKWQRKNNTRRRGLVDDLAAALHKAASEAIEKRALQWIDEKGLSS